MQCGAHSAGIESDSEVEQAVNCLIDENLALGRTEVVARAHWMMGRINVARGNDSTKERHSASAGLAIGHMSLVISSSDTAKEVRQFFRGQTRSLRHPWAPRDGFFFRFCRSLSMAPRMIPNSSGGSESSSSTI